MITPLEKETHTKPQPYQEFRKLPFKCSCLVAIQPGSSYVSGTCSHKFGIQKTTIQIVGAWWQFNPGVRTSVGRALRDFMCINKVTDMEVQ